jgi:hypothetical protein
MTASDAAAGDQFVCREETTEKIFLFVAAAILSKKFCNYATNFK